MEEVYALVATIGGVACLMIIEAFYIWKAKKRIIELEKALGPVELMSIDESKMSRRMHKEILVTLEWLRGLRHQIPDMNNTMLKSLRDELTGTHEMYCAAFGKDFLAKVTSHEGVQLKQALLLHIEITIGLIEMEIANRSYGANKPH